MTKHRALEDTLNRAQHYGAMAVDALALFPASPMKTALEQVVAFLSGAVALSEAAVILRCALLRASKDGQHIHPSRLAEDGSHLRMTAEYVTGLAQHPPHAPTTADDRAGSLCDARWASAVFS